MDEKIRVTWQDLSVGRRLPWNVYAESGKLLLGVGHIIPNQAMLDNMRQYVMYRDEIPESYLSESGGPGETSPFALMDELVSRLNGICKDIEAGEKNAGENIVRLVKDLMNMCATEPDASIATIHVPNKYSYSLYHSIQCAVICVLLGMKTKMPVKDLQMLCAASLLANISMLQLQNELFIRGGKASDEEQQLIKSHPQRSVKMLQQAGLNNRMLLDIVLKHHERLDGSGYPSELKVDQISPAAMMLAIADRYGAMVTMRGGRKPIPVNESLKNFLVGAGTEYDQRLSLLLIKELTVFPPGSFVKLHNGETAIVIRRGRKNPMQPVVKSIEGVDGRRYSNPLLRDCSIHDYEITGVCSYDNSKPLNLNKIWDYV